MAVEQDLTLSAEGSSQFAAVCCGGQLVTLYVVEAQTEEDRRVLSRPSLKPNEVVKT